MLPLLRIHQISDSRFSSNGDSTLVQYSDHFRQTNVLVDCGIHRSVVCDYLQESEVDKIDLVIISHIDMDHIGGLRNVLSSVDVDELWVMNIDPLKRFVERSIGFEREKAHFWRCITLAHESIVTAGKRNVRCSSVYEGVRRKIGPFYLEVLSPSFAFEQFLSDPKNVERILNTPKGQTYKRFLEKQDRIREDVSTEIQAKRQEISEEIGPLLENAGFIHERAEELLEDHFSLASRGLLNNMSVVVRLSCLAPSCPTPVFEPLSILFPGDLEDWEYLLSKHHDCMHTSIIKVPHHGSWKVEFRGQSLYRFLTPHLSFVFPYPKHRLPSQDVIALLARNGIVSCVSCKQLGQTKSGIHSSNQCCHSANKCRTLDTAVYEITPHGFVVKNGQSICVGTFRP